MIPTTAQPQLETPEKSSIYSLPNITANMGLSHALAGTRLPNQILRFHTNQAAPEY